MNKVILIGRLTKDVEVRETQSGVKVASFTVAVDRRYQQNGERQTDFINCVAWRQTAEFIGKYFNKGKKICVEGELQVRQYQDKEGNNRYATEVIVSQAEFVESRAAESGAPAQQEYTPVSEDEDLPF